jgi:hypothetical protein
MMSGAKNAAIAGAVLWAMCAGVGTAQAESVAWSSDPIIKIGATDVGNGTVVSNPDGSFTLAGTQSGGAPDPTWLLDWNLTVDYDPFINGSLSVTNLSTTTRNYELAISLPVSAFTPSLYGGSISATVFDLNGDHSASVAPSTAAGAGPGIYQGTIDGSAVLNLFGMVLSCTSATSGCSATGSDQDGLPNATIPGPGVANSIGTVLKFSLSAGDKVTFSTNFTVVPVNEVPLPASGWLLLGALGAGLLTRKRFSGASGSLLGAASAAPAAA